MMEKSGGTQLFQDVAKENAMLLMLPTLVP
jgi:hypothetical protein